MTIFDHMTRNVQRSTSETRCPCIPCPKFERSTFDIKQASANRRSSANAPSLKTWVPAKGAFTLVETALALLAISLGLLGIFGLARHGLRNAGDTENETRCALLAETIIETLKAKNAEILAQDCSLANWRLFWNTFNNNQSSFGSYYCHLPQMPDVTTRGALLKIICGTHSLQDQLAISEREPNKWNPQYILVIRPDSESQFLIQVAIHPGVLQGGAEWRAYYASLSYAGGLP